ncbi:glycoside hydrolase family 140 protein [Nibricoccus sp. IMCC34717]|uniref:glycoside hydrolase family 140 protein n=1 Tax=Nibricoccus sp. IMCC34717 TaxID=3034021 RepID=UPI00384CF53E
MAHFLRRVLPLAVLFTFFASLSSAAPAPLPRLRVSEDGHYLQTADGRPFFWCADTAWNLIHYATPAECSYYLKTRADQQFTVVKTVALSEFNCIKTPNTLGEFPFHDGNPDKPNDRYFQRIVDIVDEAGARGLYVGLVVTWGDKLTAPWGDGPKIFRLDNLPVAYGYAAYLGHLLRERTNVVFILGGDRPGQLFPAEADRFPQDMAARCGIPLDTDWRPIWREMARGLRESFGPNAVITYHPCYQSSRYFPNEPWLSFFGIQSGHGRGHDMPVWELIERDYALKPTKPTIDLEPNYEDHPYNPWPQWDPATGRFRDHDVRKQLYRAVFAGAAGVSYGHHSVWAMVGSRNAPFNHSDPDWVNALHRPGATQLRHLRSLFESRPSFDRVPDQKLIVGDAGKRGLHLRAMRDKAGSYAWIYFPTNDQECTVDLSLLRSQRVLAWWFDPRTGFSHPAGEFQGGRTQLFQSPPYGPDWVLMLEDPAAGYARPGL